MKSFLIVGVILIFGVVAAEGRSFAPVCKQFCHEIAAVTVYNGTQDEHALDVKYHQIKFSSFVVDRRIALTAASSWLELIQEHGAENIRICHVHYSRPKGEAWRSCGKIFRYVLPKKYSGPGGALDLVMIKITAGNLGAVRKDPDLINFKPIEMSDNTFVYGYGHPVNGNESTGKRYFKGTALSGTDAQCGFSGEVRAHSYLCVVDTDGKKGYKHGDEGGIFVYNNRFMGGVWSVGGIVTNFNGTYGEPIRVLRFDRPPVENFIRRVTATMKGELDEADYYTFYYEYN